MALGLTWWRFKGDREWKLGYVTQMQSGQMIRIGNYNGDTMGGRVVEEFDVEFKKYTEHLRYGA